MIITIHDLTVIVTGDASLTSNRASSTTLLHNHNSFRVGNYNYC
jgi:hypothetical protein